MKCLLIILNLFYFISKVSSLILVVQPQTIVGSPTLLAWTIEDSDPPSLIFDLRFVQGVTDVGLARANIAPSDSGSDAGTVMVTFPSSGNYVLKAVSGSPRNTVIGTSGPVQAIQLTSTSTSSSVSSASVTINAGPVASTSTSPSSSAPSTSTSPTSPTPTSPTKLNNLKKNPNIPAIVGGIVGVLLLSALIAFIYFFVQRRRKALTKRLTFHRDMMVQRRSPSSHPASIHPNNMSSQTLSDTGSDVEAGGGGGGEGGVGVGVGGGVSSATHNHDVEQGLGVEDALSPGPSRSLGLGHIIPSPKGPRPSIKRTEHTIITITPPLVSPPLPPLPHSVSGSEPQDQPLPPRTQRQQDIADRITMLRGQMLDVQNLRRPKNRADDDDERRESSVTSPTSTIKSADSVKVRVLDDMHREMVWLRDQEHSPWALGLTDVLPPGHARYMTP